MDDVKKKYLFDIQNAICSVEGYFEEGKKIISEYEKNDMLQKAVERQIEIIGEAVNRLSKMDPDLKITNARRIVDTRNYMIHGYDKVSNEIIWSIVIKHLPLLKNEVDVLLED
jgi:uncharacterized protein with HEPN domain